jgi:hypothetical protein
MNVELRFEHLWGYRRGKDIQFPGREGREEIVFVIKVVFVSFVKSIHSRGQRCLDAMAQDFVRLG